MGLLQEEETEEPPLQLTYKTPPGLKSSHANLCLEPPETLDPY